MFLAFILYTKGNHFYFYLDYVQIIIFILLLVFFN